MGEYKGVQVSGQLAGLLRHMDEVDEHREALQSLQSAWDTLAMLGELSGMGVQIGEVRSAFAELTGRLLNHLGEQALRKAALALRARSHVAIDILVRNLFERTADIGFLATDPELRRHAEEGDEARRSGQAALVERLREYRRNYSVYDDVLLLSPGGQVLARLDERFGAAAAFSSEPWLAEAAAGRMPYLERYGPTELRPGAGPALIYACPVPGSRGQAAIAVLALCFDLADECRRIFASLDPPRGEPAGWTVVALLDASGRVIASSDAQQLPPGTPLGLAALATGQPGTDSGAQVMRHGGRRWLALTCAAQPYQGYAGPGWYGHAMVPLEHAFEPDSAADAEGGEDAGSGAGGGFSLQQLPPAVRASLMASPQLFSEALRSIAPAADAIEAELKRTVWNGNVALGAQPPGREAQFSRTLLREIGRTGARSRAVFTRAIANMNRTVVSATLADSQTRAALAMDIMDRNLYERANDCRWWALTPLFREALAASALEAPAQAALEGVLKTIHGLYTVYANLLLFDRSGTVVAVSRPDAQAAPGRQLAAGWVEQCLALTDPQAYCVSPYEPSALYGGELTCIYAAAVRAPGDAQRVVGGIAIVFDARPQFEAMLADSVASSGGFGVFVEPGGRIVASTRADLPAGSQLPAGLLAAATAAHAAPTGDAGEQRLGGADGIVSFEQHHHAVGARLSSGYREFSALRGGAAKIPAGYQHRMAALVFVPLARLDAASALPAGRPAALAWPPSPLPVGARAPLDLASFTVAGQWYGLPCEVVVEALMARRIMPLARGDARLRGTVLHGGAAIAIFDLAALLEGTSSNHPPAAAEHTVIVLRGSGGQPAFGLLVDSLGEHLQVPRERLERLDRLYPNGSAWVESLVRAPHGAQSGTMLMVLSADRLTAELSGAPLPAAA